MQSYRSPSLPRAQKRMRIGTKSCAECRRRKVRCVFKENKAVCEECAIHETPCLAQQPDSPALSLSDADPDPAVRQRLDRLERLMGHLYSNLDLQEASSSGNSRLLSAAAALRRVLPDAVASSPEDYQSPSSPSTGGTSTPWSQDAPLISLFNEAMLLHGGDAVSEPSDDVSAFSATSSRLLDPHIKALKALVPHADLHSILSLTERCFPVWPIWPTVYAVADADAWLADCLRSKNHHVFAKGILFLTLAIKQLPKDFEFQRNLKQVTPLKLLSAYLHGVSPLMADDHALGSYELVECLAMRGKLNLDLGRAYQCWLDIRKGLNLGMVQGLHRMHGGDADKLWNMLWQMDKHMSLHLGLVDSLPETHPSLSAAHDGTSLQDRATRALARFAGAINARNQRRDTADYAETVALEAHLQHMQATALQPWWSAPLVPGPTPALLYNRGAYVILFHQMRILLHMPYVPRAAAEPALEPSRLAALDAARALIVGYMAMRAPADDDPAALIVCDLMDFQAFSAALVLGLNAFARPADPVVPDDWALVARLAAALPRVAAVLNCAVASQASRLLDALARAFRGEFDDRAGTRAAIPHFGTVRIRRGVGAGPAEVLVNASPFMPYGAQDGLGVPFDMEVGVDWTADWDAGAAGAWAWNEMFQAPPTVTHA